MTDRGLVVDDDPGTVSRFKRQFGEEGWAVEEATSGRAVLNTLARADR